MRGLSRLFGLLVAACGVQSSLVAQCPTDWVPSQGSGGLSSAPDQAVAWDPDGAGPLPPVVVFRGNFTSAGPLATASGIAAWDPASDTWFGFTQGSGWVSQIGLDPNGALIVCRNPLSAATSLIERWTGTGWQQIGGQLSYVRQIGSSNGTLVALPYVWNGAAWTPLGYPGNYANSFTTAANGDLVVAFSAPLLQFPTLSVHGVAQLTNGAWTMYGNTFDNVVQKIVTMPNGDVIVNGSFTATGTTSCARIARWDGSAWQPMGSGVNYSWNLLPRANGDLIVGSVSIAGGVAVDGIATWSNGVWSATTAGLGQTGLAVALCDLPSGLAVGGGFASVLGQPARNVAVWQGGSWLLPGVAPNQVDCEVLAAAALGGDDCVIGGTFTSVGAVPAANIARRVGGVWTALGSGTDNAVRAVARMPNGDLIAGGNFGVAGGTPASRLARWDGSAWHAMPGNGMVAVNAMAVMPNGHLVVGGTNQVATWDGVAWTILFGANSIRALTIDATGAPLAAGALGATTGVLRWNGSAWQLLSPPNWGSSGVVCLPNGDIIADLHTDFGMGVFDQLVRWNGASWTAISGGLAFADISPLLALPNGDFAVAVPLPSPSSSLQRCDGQTLMPFTAGATNGRVNVMAALASGEFLVGGLFDIAGAQGVRNLARMAATCPATSTPLGTGCNGAAGPLAMATISLPWLGGTFVAETSGLPANALGLAVTSFSSATIPLAVLSPTAGANCDGLLSPLLSDVLIPSNGRARSGFALPDTVAAAGLQLFHYAASLEFDAAGALIGLAATNRLALVLGRF